MSIRQSTRISARTEAALAKQSLGSGTTPEKLQTPGRKRQKIATTSRAGDVVQSDKKGKRRAESQDCLTQMPLDSCASSAHLNLLISTISWEFPRPFMIFFGSTQPPIFGVWYNQLFSFHESCWLIQGIWKSAWSAASTTMSSGPQYYPLYKFSVWHSLSSMSCFGVEASY